MKIKVGDMVVLNSKHVMEETTVTILRKLPAPGGEMWEAIVVNGKTKTWVAPWQVKRKVDS